MRSALLLLAIATVGNVMAQEQERKLLDRILKPEMSLQNNIQEKRFDPGATTLTRTARTKPFFVAKRSTEREYQNVKKVSAKEFPADASRFSGQQANTTTRTQLAKVDTTYPAGSYDTRAAAGADKAVETAGYPGSRPFLLQGKSQKSLSAKDRPLTIDEVRELLNKNK